MLSFYSSARHAVSCLLLLFLIIILTDANDPDLELKYLYTFNTTTECPVTANALHLKTQFIIHVPPQYVYDLYVCGYNNDLLLLDSNVYNLTLTQTSLDYARFSNLNTRTDNKMSFQIQSFASDSMGTMQLYSHHSVSSNNITINIHLTDCNVGYYQNHTTDVMYHCTLCDNHTYSFDNRKCKSCDEKAIVCYNGNNIYIKQKYYGININGTIQTAYCSLSNHCCAQKQCELNNVCHRNRNSSALLCGVCNNGFCESLSIVGRCVKCDAHHSQWYIIMFSTLYIVICSFLVWILYNISYWIVLCEERDASKPHIFVVLIWHNLLTFYQTLQYLQLFQFDLQAVYIVSNICSLNFFLFDLPFDKNISARDKLVLYLLPFFIFVVIIFILYIQLLSRKASINSKKALRCTIWFIFTSMYLHTFGVFMKLSHCTSIKPYGMRMTFSGNDECYDAQQIISLVIAICGLIIFPCALFAYLRSDKKHALRFVMLYSYEKYMWQYEIIQLLRKSIPLMIVFWSDDDKNHMIGYFQFIVLMMFLQWIPFENKLNNEIEMILLIISFIISVFGLTSPILDPNIIKYIIVILSFAPLSLVPYSLYLYAKNPNRIPIRYIFNCRTTYRSNGDVVYLQNVELQ